MGVSWFLFLFLRNDDYQNRDEGEASGDLMAQNLCKLDSWFLLFVDLLALSVSQLW